MRKETLLPRAVRLGLIAIVVVSALVPVAESAEPRDRNRLREPVFRVRRPDRKPAEQHLATPAQPGVFDLTQRPKEHPLMPAIRLAKEGLVEIDNNIKDYSCTLVKREQIDGKVTESQYMFTKVRHKPFSIYMYFLKPDGNRGNECIYVEGRNQGKLVARAGKGAERLFGTVHLDPSGRLAMRGQKYPITEVGIRNLTTRLVEVAEKDAQFGECEVQNFQARIEGRPCTCIQATHPFPRQNFTFYVARVFIDNELRVPVRYVAYEWPKQRGGKPVLQEEYTYVKLKTNNGFTDLDFDPRNPNYGFQ